MTSVWLSAIALAVSILAAAFTGWQALSAHSIHRDSRHVELLLVPNKRSAGGQLRHEPTYRLENAGNGTAIDIVVTITYSSPDIGAQQIFTAKPEGSVAGHSYTPLTFDREAPAPTAPMQGTGEMVGLHLTAAATFRVPGGYRNHRTKLPIRY